MAVECSTVYSRLHRLPPVLAGQTMLRLHPVRSSVFWYFVRQGTVSTGFVREVSQCTEVIQCASCQRLRQRITGKSCADFANVLCQSAASDKSRSRLVSSAAF